MNSTPRFPVIAISRGDSFLVLDEPIRRCSYAGWRNGYFDGLAFFDGDGRLWPTRASLRRRLRFCDRFRRSLPVDVRYGRPRDDAREEAVGMLETLVDDDPDDLYDQRSRC